MDVSLVNLLGVSVVAFLVPFVLGFFPRLRVPSVVLELVAGIIIGPAVLGWIEPGPVVGTMSSIGVAFLLFLAGLELDLDALKGPPSRLGTFAFLLSFALALAMMSALGSAGLILSLLLAVVAVAAVVLLQALRLTSKWQPGRRILDRLDDTSAQMRVRFAVMVLLAAAVLSVTFGFEAILGTFLAGVVFGLVIRGDRFEHSLRTKLEAIGFGFFVPVFFVTSGLRFDLAGMATAEEAGRVAIFFFALLATRGLPALLYRRHLAWRQTVAAGLLQATNLSFIVVAVTVGRELGKLREMNGSALIVAGLLSAVVFPAIAQMLLGGHGEVATAGAGYEARDVEERL